LKKDDAILYVFDAKYVPQENTHAYVRSDVVVVSAGEAGRNVLGSVKSLMTSGVVSERQFEAPRGLHRAFLATYMHDSSVGVVLKNLAQAQMDVR
jgi:hypothetical protein